MSGKLRLECVANSYTYKQDIFFLRFCFENAPFFLTKYVPGIDEHMTYMRLHEANYFVCVDENDYTVGFVGVVNGDIRFAVDPAHKSKGIGTFMLTKIKKMYPESKGGVLEGNIGSMKAFDKAGISYTILKG